MRFINNTHHQFPRQCRLVSKFTVSAGDIPYWILIADHLTCPAWFIGTELILEGFPYTARRWVLAARPDYLVEIGGRDPFRCRNGSLFAIPVGGKFPIGLL